MMSRFQRGSMLCGILLPAICGAQSSGCYTSTTDAAAVLLRDFARIEVGSTDSTQVAGRAIIGLPTLDSANVIITVDARVCSSVVAAINTYLNTPGAIRRVEIAKLVNSGYLAYDGYFVRLPNTGSNPVYFISKQFQVKAVLLGL